MFCHVTEGCKWQTDPGAWKTKRCGIYPCSDLLSLTSVESQQISNHYFCKLFLGFTVNVLFSRSTNVCIFCWIDLRLSFFLTQNFKNWLRDFQIFRLPQLACSGKILAVELFICYIARNRSDIMIFLTDVACKIGRNRYFAGTDQRTGSDC